MTNIGNVGESKSNMPSDSKDGLHRDKKLTYQTLKDMEIVRKDYMNFAKEFGLTLDNINEIINESMDNLLKTNKENEETIKEYEKNIKEMKKKYRGVNKHIADEYETYTKTQIEELKKRNEESKDTVKKNMIKEQFKSEKEENSIKSLDSKYIKSNPFAKIDNNYYSEIEKLKSSALDMFGVDFENNAQYKTAMDNLKKEFNIEKLKQRFKEESEQNQTKVLDSKYSKGNSLAEKKNEYYNQLEKLKSSALDTYGEDFENNEDYKKALMNLNGEFSKEIKDAWKEDFKENHKTLSEISSGIKDTFDRNKETLQGLLGPLNLFIEPLKNFFGGFGAVFKFIGGGVKKIFGKFTKKNPNASDVLKTGAFGVGSLYIGHKLEELFGKTKGNDESKLDKIKNGINMIKGLGGGGALGGMIGLGKGGALKGVLANASKMAGPLAIASAVIMMVVDAIKGIFKSKEWNVSKLGGALGAFFAGASEGGLKGAFSNMGKWALLGAGIGTLICPGVGTIAGGVIGGAVGAILGAIGGKTLAQGFDKLGAKLKDWFLNVWWSSIKEPFIILKKSISDIWKSDMSIGKKVGAIVGETLMYFVNSTKLYFTKNIKFFSNLFGKSKDFKKSIVNFGTSVMNGFKNFDFKKSMSSLGEKFDNIWGKILTFREDFFEGVKESSIGQFVSNLLDKIKDKFGDWLGKIKESPIGKFIDDLFSKISEGVTTFFNENPIGVWIKSSIITPIQKGLGTIGDFFGFISDNWDWKKPIESIANIVGGFKEDKKTGVSKFDIWKSEKVDDAIIRADGSVIKTNPKDTLVALKDIPLSMEQIRSDTTKNLNSSLNTLESDKNLENKLMTIIEVLSKILAKDVQVNLPPQTRSDLDIIMNGGMI